MTLAFESARPTICLIIPAKQRSEVPKKGVGRRKRSKGGKTVATHGLECPL